MTERSPDWITRQIATAASYAAHRTAMREAWRLHEAERQADETTRSLAVLEFRKQRVHPATGKTFRLPLRAKDDLLDIPGFLRR